jgi:hypothetical protein
MAVQSARIRGGWTEIGDWADAVGRSTRILLGLERGETTGSATLRRIEDLLKWRPGYAGEILADEHADLAPNVTRALERGTGPPRPARDLDEFTTEELLDEVNLRYSSLALELHNLGHPTMTMRQEGPDEVWEPLSPAERRRADESDA